MTNFKYFTYSQQEIDYLSNKDKKLKKVMELIGFIKRPVNHDLFQSITQSIVGQQISTAVQKNIMNKLKDRFPLFNAYEVNKVSLEELRSFGLSMRKAIYIKEFSEKIVNKQLDLEKLKTLSDDEVVQVLTSLKGVGPWTAEMTLIFALERKNVFSFGDLAIKRGLSKLYGHQEITRELFEKYRKQFSPYCSVASLYLWEISSNKYLNF